MSESVQVLVTGGSGFLGRALLRQLAGGPDKVSQLLRSPPKEGPSSGQTVPADLTELEADHPAFASVNTVIHAAVDYSSASRSVEMVRRVLAASHAHGVRRIIYISSHNAGFSQPGRYSQGKIRGERLVQASGLEWVILRPTLLYGSDGGPFLTSLIRLARNTRIIPVLGNGESKIQPAHRRDVAAIAAAGLTGLDEQVVTIGGAESISLHELAVAIRELVGPSLLLRLPISLLRIPAAVHQPLSDKLLELDEDKTLDSLTLRTLHDLLGREPRSLKADLQSIVG